MTASPSIIIPHQPGAVNNVGQLPWQLADESVCFTPTYRGKTASPLSGDAWHAKTPYTEENVANWFVHNGDLMVQLRYSNLLIFDCDVKTKHVAGVSSVTFGESFEVAGDGRKDLAAWVAANKVELPETFTVESGGRDDGSHLPGVHAYYRQDKDWPIVHDVSLTSCLEVKSSWCRYWSTFKILRDLPIATLPKDVAKLVLPASQVRTGIRSDGRKIQLTWKDLSTIAGLNDYYVLLKATFLKKGLGTEDEIDEFIRRGNSALRDPMPIDRLDKTITSGRKGW